MRHGIGPVPDETNAIATSVIGGAIQVHRTLGPGLLESVYEAALTVELRARGHETRNQLGLPVRYRGEVVGADLRLDMLVDDRIVVELKSVEALLPIHRAQLLTYMRLSGCRVGLLLNFNVPVLRDGIRRLAL